MKNFSRVVKVAGIMFASLLLVGCGTLVEEATIPSKTGTTNTVPATKTAPVNHENHPVDEHLNHPADAQGNHSEHQAE